MLVETRSGTRSIHRPDIPSQALLRLGQVTGNKIFSPDSGRYCEYTTENFIGSLIAGLLQDELFDIGRMNWTSPTNYLTNPFSYVTTPTIIANFSRVDGKATEAVYTTISSPILVKRLCGHEIGVVLEGEFAGLMISKSRLQPNICTIERVWNDTVTSAEIYKPYFSKFYKECSRLQNAQLMAWELIFDRWTALSADFEYYSTLFLHLCSQHGVPYDETNFHATTHP